MSINLGRVVAGVWLALACGCSEDTTACPAISVAGLSVTIRGAANPDGGTIEVTVTDGDYEEELECSPRDGSLVCTGARDRAGTYVVEVIANGDVVETEEVTVPRVRCGVETVEITI